MMHFYLYFHVSQYSMLHFTNIQQVLVRIIMSNYKLISDDPRVNSEKAVEKK